MTITDGMAAPPPPHRKPPRILTCRFCRKDRNAQVVGSGDTHVKGGAKTPNSCLWHGPRRNPEIVIASPGTATGRELGPYRSQIVVTYVKQRHEGQNVLDQAGESNG